MIHRGDRLSYTSRVSCERNGVWVEEGTAYKGAVVEVNRDPFATEDDDCSYYVLQLDNGARVAIDALSSELDPFERS